MWVVIIGILAIAFLGAVMGSRLKGATISLGKFFKGGVEANTAGPSVLRAEAYGKSNEITADGPNAKVQDALTVGEGNKIGAGTGGIAQKPSVKP
jgi:hypothetical protein